MLFGKCPVCDAIVSLDPERNVLCDRCHQDRWTPYWEQWQRLCQGSGRIPDQTMVEEYKEMFKRKAE